MSKLKRFWLASAATAWFYIWTEQLWKMWSETARNIHQTMKVAKDHVVDSSLNILNTTSPYIWNDAPLSYFGIQQLAARIWNIIDNVNIVDITLLWLGVYVWAKIWNWWSKKVSELIWVSHSKWDQIISQAVTWFVWAWTLLQIPEVLNTGAIWWAYLISRKLWEKVLWERYSHLIWWSWAMALASVMHNGSIMNSDIFSIAAIGLWTSAAILKLKNDT